MRVLVCGGREYGDWRPKWPMNEGVTSAEINARNELEARHFEKALSEIPISFLIAGGARGADTLAERYADVRGIPKAIYPVTPYDWGKHGKWAGHRRNYIMLREGKPDLVVAFPGGRGTAHMKKIAREANVEVREISNP